jgi:uncharacterized protein (DUF362 family)
MKPGVFVTHLTYEKANHSFQHSIEYFSSTLTKSVKIVCIKVNLCDYRLADSGATTDPALLGTLIEVLQNKFCPQKIFVIENDATSVETNSLFNLLGFREVAQKHSIQLVNAADEEWIRRPVPDGKVFTELEVPRIWLEADLTVNFAKLKTNMVTQITGCLKNMFGLLREKRKSVYHGQINKVIGDINLVMPSDLCIVDGLIGQEGAGPAFGKPKRCELLITGTDPVSVDSCCARIMGFNPWFIKHIVHCQRRGIGNLKYILETDIQKFSYNNYKFKFSRTEYLIRSIIRRFAHLSAAG